MKHVIFITLTFFLSLSSFAYEHEKCMKAARNWAPPMNFFSSVSSYFSSTGECSMLGKLENRKQIFIASNIGPLQKDMAMGNGEYIDAYAVLSDCRKEARSYLPSLLQKNYMEIWGEELDRNPRSIYESLEIIILSDPITKQGCGVKS